MEDWQNEIDEIARRAWGIQNWQECPTLSGFDKIRKLLWELAEERCSKVDCPCRDFNGNCPIEEHFIRLAANIYGLIELLNDALNWDSKEDENADT
jgi:hypothetical protein